ncbi:MAG: DUF748 domain-containing protein [Alistipes sp.]
MKKIFKIVLILVAILVVLVVATALLISPLAKSYIVKHSKELIGRQVTMDKFKFNIFSGELHVTDLKMLGAEDSTDFFSFAAFDMKMRLLPLLSHRVMVDQIALTQPDLTIYQKGSEFNFSDLLTKFQSDTTAVKEPSKPWEIGIYNISLHNGHVFYKDLLLDAAWGFNDLNLTIPGVYFSSKKTDVGVLLNFAEGGSLETAIAYNIENSDYDITVKLKELSLANTLPYLRQALHVTTVDGLLSADMHIIGNVEHLLAVRVDGTADVTNFLLGDDKGQPIFSVNSAHVNLAEGDLQQMNYKFKEVRVSGFSTHFELRRNGTTNFDNLVKSTPASPTDQADVSQPTPRIHIADLEINGSSVTLSDLSPIKPFKYHLSNICVKSLNFDPATKNKMTIDARIQQTGAVKIRWEGSLTDLNNQNIAVLLSNINLRDFTPYCEHYTAYPLTKGNLNFRSQNIIRSGYLNGTNHLDMFEPKVDKKRKDIEPEFKVPLKLGLYILKDKKGHVKIDLPVKGSLNSPEFSYRKIVMKALGNVLLKVVTAPFSFLMGHNNNVEYINIDPLSPIFESEQYAKFDQLAQVLKDKPDMKITLTQRINYAEALSEQAENNLKMAYYNHTRQTADTTAVPSQQTSLSMLDYEQIQHMDFTSTTVATFADSLLHLRGIDPTTLKNTSAKAQVLYSAAAAAQLSSLMATRDKTLMEYMTTLQAIPATAFKISAADSTAFRTYTGKDRYTIALEVDGESVEVSPNDAAATPDGKADAANTPQ